ncbi:MAG: CidA/LrgA family protein [Alphaproteobacteria bacterium]|nr:CidA/LrgA family protein [Alphaproteobacteria bacterium]
MLEAAAIILLAQALAEALVRAFGLPVSGPVLGLMLLLLAFALRPGLAARAEPIATPLHRHMGLFFVAPGVGLLAHTDLLRTDWAPLAVAILGSTVLTLAVAALAFVLTARLAGAAPPATEPGTEDRP